MYHELADAGYTPEATPDIPSAQQASGMDAAHGDGMAPIKRTRSRDGKNIILRVFPEEHDDIAARATESGLTISEFIRRIAMGYKTQSRFDYDVMEHLIRARVSTVRSPSIEARLDVKEQYYRAKILILPITKKSNSFWNQTEL